MPRPFAHLHLHTQYSLLDGAIKHKALFERAKSVGMPRRRDDRPRQPLRRRRVLREGAKKAGVKPILGCEVYVASGSRFERKGREKDEAGFDAINHLLLLAMNETGYRNLMYLVSMGYLEGFYYKPRIDLDLLRQHSEGLIATSGCLSSMISRAILDRRRDARLAAGRGVLRDLPGPLLPRDAAPRHPGAGRGQRRADQDGVGPAPAARRDQRRALPRELRPRSARRRCSASARRRTSTTRSASASTGRAST